MFPHKLNYIRDIKGTLPRLWHSPKLLLSDCSLISKKSTTSFNISISALSLLVSSMYLASSFCSLFIFISRSILSGSGCILQSHYLQVQASLGNSVHSSISSSFQRFIGTASHVNHFLVAFIKCAMSWFQIPLNLF
jgi:hypothetical protein